MTEWKGAKSGKRRYILEAVSGGWEIRRHEGTFLTRSNPWIGSASDLTEAAAIIKSDSGAKEIEYYKWSP